MDKPTSASALSCGGSNAGSIPTQRTHVSAGAWLGVLSLDESADWVAAESVQPSGQQKRSTQTSVSTATMVAAATILSTESVYRQRPDRARNHGPQRTLRRAHAAAADLCRSVRAWPAARTEVPWPIAVEWHRGWAGWITVAGGLSLIVAGIATFRRAHDSANFGEPYEQYRRPVRRWM